MPHGAGVAEFAGEAVVTVHHFPIDHNSGADTGTEGDHDEVLHTAGRAVGHFTHRGGVRIVREGHGDAVHLLLEHFGERDVSALGPYEVHGVLDDAGVEVTVRDAHADAADASFGLGLHDDAVQGFGERRDEFVRVAGIFGTDDSLGDDVAAGVHDAALGGLAAYVDTDYEILYHVIRD